MQLNSTDKQCEILNKNLYLDIYLKAYFIPKI